ncbi:MAG: hypothetical protein HDT43_10650 [Ruminococcaceae bacterium]|nr:hypothetical protein [Oscillospiraceae bacterium]
MKRIIAAIMVLVLAVPLSGCKEVPSFMPSYWDGLTKSGAREYIQNTLREKYGEEFEVISMGIRSGQYYRELVADCSPKSDENIVFQIEVNHFGESRTVKDDYIRNIVRKLIKRNIDDILSKYYETFAVEVNVMGLDPFYDLGIQSADEVSVKTFSESFSDDEKNEVAVWIILDKEEIENQEIINKALRETSKEYFSLNVYIDCFYANQEDIDVGNETAQSINTNRWRFLSNALSGNFPKIGFVYHSDGSGLVQVEPVKNEQ